jgi:hypothetical protein
MYIDRTKKYKSSGGNKCVMLWQQLYEGLELITPSRIPIRLVPARPAILLTHTHTLSHRPEKNNNKGYRLFNTPIFGHFLCIKG